MRMSYWSSDVCPSDLDIVEHVLAQRDHHRAGAPLHRDAEGARDEFGNPARVVDLDRPFRDAGKGLRIIEFLERLAVAEAALDLPDEQDHRRDRKSTRLNSSH